VTDLEGNLIIRLTKFHKHDQRAAINSIIIHGNLIVTGRFEQRREYSDLLKITFVVQVAKMAQLSITIGEVDLERYIKQLQFKEKVTYRLISMVLWLITAVRNHVGWCRRRWALLGVESRRCDEARQCVVGLDFTCTLARRGWPITHSAVRSYLEWSTLT